MKTRKPAVAESRLAAILNQYHVGIATVVLGSALCSTVNADVFNRIASFPVFQNTSVEAETVAEIVAASADGNILVYTDGKQELIGFVDISTPNTPTAAGTVDVGGEPTSVGVAGDFALAAVNTSSDFVNVGGHLNVIDIAGRSIVRTLDLGGQPDSVAVSPDGSYAAIAIENERDEDLGDGNPPQAPGGFLVVVNLIDPANPATWTLTNVSLDNLPGMPFPADPEPEYVDINGNNVAVVTLQENNHLALVDLPTASVTGSFSAGTVNLTQVDATEEDPALILATESLNDVPREPDGVSWVNDEVIATADEGDMDGGSRGFTFFDTNGNVLYDAGNSVEHETIRLGHYPDGRSENKGNEPENVETGIYGGERYLFVGSERSSVIPVYHVDGTGTGASPTLVQTLPAGVAPEGLLAIPSRNLFVAASEEDNRSDTIRSVINIYQKQSGSADYPTVVSADRQDGTPIPWGALSALASDPHNPNRVYSVYDSFYGQSRIFTLDVSSHPAVITHELPLMDSNGLLAGIQAGVLDASDNSTPVGITLVNPDNTVNLDPEGLTIAPNGNFWVASEGDDSPFFPNMLVEVTPAGHIVDLVLLPNSTRARIDNNGFEGVAAVGEYLYVAFQRHQWDDIDNRARIGRYDTTSGQWSFYFYPVDDPTSPNGGWVGLSELTYVGNDSFLVIERDNQAGSDATIKRVYQFSIAGLTPLGDTPVGTDPSFPLVGKTLVKDLIPDLQATGGRVLEKVEGLALMDNGDMLIVIDNDGVKDSNGETQLFRAQATGSLVNGVAYNTADRVVTVSGENLTVGGVRVLADSVQLTLTARPDGSLQGTVPSDLTGDTDISVQTNDGAILAHSVLNTDELVAEAIPTLSEYGVILLMLLLSAAGANGLRKPS